MRSLCFTVPNLANFSGISAPTPRAWDRQATVECTCARSHAMGITKQRLRPNTCQKARIAASALRRSPSTVCRSSRRMRWHRENYNGRACNIGSHKAWRSSFSPSPCIPCGPARHCGVNRTVQYAEMWCLHGLHLSFDGLVLFLLGYCSACAGTRDGQMVR